jgi:cellulose synthase operon protein YhjQ
MPLICFASPKGGVGKTTFAANIACALARAGQQVVALDLDPQNAVRLPFGVPLKDPLAFTALLTRRPDWRRCLRSTPSGVGLLAYGPSDMAAAIVLADAVSSDPGLLAAPVRDMLAVPGLTVVVDTVPGPSPLLSALLPRVDLLLTVLLADAGSVSLVPTVESGACYVAFPRERLVYALNQYDPRGRLGPPIATAVAQHFGNRLLGCIYRDETVGEALAAQRPVTDYAPASKAAHDLGALATSILARLHGAAAARGVAA